MQWQNHRTLAEGLRDQGLCDLLVAKYCLDSDSDFEFKLFERPMNLGHVVVAKSQQAVEKITKGWLLWLSSSFDPTKGHSPFTREIDSAKQSKEFKKLLISLNRINKKVVNDIKWLENLAPRPPQNSTDHAGTLMPLSVITENSEYPFWSGAPRDQLVLTSEGLTIRVHGTRAIKSAKTFLKAMAQSDPKDFTDPIRRFLESHLV